VVSLPPPEIAQPTRTSGSDDVKAQAG
jgi:hypothetical protein